MKSIILKGVGGALILFLLVELALRFFLGFGSPPLLQKDPEIGYLFQANQEVHRFGNRIHINGYHQRSPDLSEKEGQRILFIGDSVTWGGSLTDQEYTYPERFRAAFRDTCNTNIDVLNASAGSWGIKNRTAYLVRFGTFSSDLVVLQVSSHDLLQPTSRSHVVGCHPSYPQTPPAFAIEELFSRYIGLRWFDMAPNCKPEEKRGRGTAEERFGQNMSSLTQAVRYARGQSARVVVLHTADRPGSEGEFSHNRWQDRFHQTMDSLSVKVIDLHQEWNGNSKVADWYRDHVHINEEGNEQVAQTLLSTLMEQPYLSCEMPESGEDALHNRASKGE